MDWILIATGLLVATLVTLTGVGGGALMTPVLILGFGLPPAMAVGTDLLYAVFTKSGAALSYARDRRVDWRAAGWMLAGSAPAVILSTAVLMWLGSSQAQDRRIRVAIGLALILSVLSMLLRRQTVLEDSVTRTIHPAWLGGAGAVIGSLVAVSSIGAGSLGMALLTRLYPGRSLRELVGTDLALAVPVAALAASGHGFLGQVDWRVALNLAIGAVPGIWIGRHLLHRLLEKWLRLILVMVLIGAATRLIV